MSTSVALAICFHCSTHTTVYHKVMYVKQVLNSVASVRSLPVHTIGTESHKLLSIPKKHAHFLPLGGVYVEEPLPEL